MRATDTVLVSPQGGLWCRRRTPAALESWEKLEACWVRAQKPVQRSEHNNSALESCQIAVSGSRKRATESVTRLYAVPIGFKSQSHVALGLPLEVV